jgi:hypothetical protein
MMSDLYFLPLNLAAGQRPSLAAAWFTSIHRDAGETEKYRCVYSRRDAGDGK